MSNKPYDKILDADRMLRSLFPAGPDITNSHQTIMATIEVIGGFELFNTRPYHNYETWGQGYRITAKGITVVAEDLDDAMNLWKSKEELNANR